MTYETSRRLVHPLASLTDKGVFWRQSVVQRRATVGLLQQATPAPISDPSSPQVAKRAVVVFDPHTSHSYDNPLAAEIYAGPRRVLNTNVWYPSEGADADASGHPWRRENNVLPHIDSFKVPRRIGVPGGLRMDCAVIAPGNAIAPGLP